LPLEQNGAVQGRPDTSGHLVEQLEFGWVETPAGPRKRTSWRDPRMPSAP
jgi:hypothetical protein